MPARFSEHAERCSICSKGVLCEMGTLIQQADAILRDAAQEFGGEQVMANYIASTRLARELAARKLVPENCRLAEVSIAPDGPLVIRYEVFVTAEQLAPFADALKAAAIEWDGPVNAERA